VNLDFTDNKNSTYINLGTCSVNLLCKLKVKYYVVKVFVVECFLSIIQTKRLFKEICLYEIIPFI
jgi:hypothetical protein